MGDLSEHFSRHEFTCKCGCEWDTVDHGLILILERLCATFHRRVFINSGNRCPSHNFEVNGHPLSKHIEGKAADINVEDTEPKEVADFLESQFSYCCGIGRYNTFTHIDSRDVKARWSNG